MSKLEDLFKRSAIRSPQPLGFGAAARHESGSGILLIGHARSQEISKSPGLAQSNVDAILLDSGGKPVSKTAANALGGVVWGSENSQFDAPAVQELKEQGCDFLVFDAARTAESAVNDDDMASFVRISDDLNRKTASALSVLGVTGLSLVEALQDEAITVQQLIDIAKLQALFDGPLLVRGSRVYTTAEITALRNAGVNALVMALDDAEAIEQIRANISEVKPQRPRGRSSSWTALAPHPPEEE